MSATITTSLNPPLKTAPLHTTPAATCHKCGADVSDLQQGFAEDPQRRIEELEQQVRILTNKATAAVDKLADYEDQLHQLKSQSHPHLKAPPNTPFANPSAPPSAPPSEPPTPYPPHLPDAVPPRPHSAVSRLSALLPSSTRRSASQPPTSSMPTTPLQHASFPPANTPTSSTSIYAPSHPASALQTPLTLHPPPLNRSGSGGGGGWGGNGGKGTPSAEDLMTALTHESALRRAAETQLERTSEEVEELTSSLFSEANEMVARERKVNRQLENRVRELEAGVLSQSQAQSQFRGKEQELGSERERNGDGEVIGDGEQEWKKEKENLEKKIREKEERVEVLEKRAREKAERLEGLERRVSRGERVRGLLRESSGGVGAGGGGTPPLLSPHCPSPLGVYSSAAEVGK